MDKQESVESIYTQGYDIYKDAQTMHSFLFYKILVKITKCSVSHLLNIQTEIPSLL